MKYQTAAPTNKAPPTAPNSSNRRARFGLEAAAGEALLPTGVGRSGFEVLRVGVETVADEALMGWIQSEFFRSGAPDESFPE